MGLKTENSDYCDRTHCTVHGRFGRCGFVHADISVRSPQRGKKTSGSIRQETGENPSRVCFDGAQFAGLGPCRVIFQFAESSSVLGDLMSKGGAFLSGHRDEHKSMSISLCPSYGLTSKGKCRFGGLTFRQSSISTSTFFDTSLARLPPRPIDSRGCHGPRQPGFGNRVAVSRFRNRFRSKCECSRFPPSIRGHSARWLSKEPSLDPGFLSFAQPGKRQARS
jgi:hypothetical protein